MSESQSTSVVNTVQTQLSVHQNLKVFKMICDFVNSLAEEYGAKNHPLKLYRQLIANTKICHDVAINKHITIFTNFCVVNREAIATQEVSKIAKSDSKLKYSEKVYIDMLNIFHLIGDDKDNERSIWKHILAISAFVDPSSNAKNILKKFIENSETKEEEFLKGIFNRADELQDVNPNDIMNSDLIKNIVGGVQNGKMNPEKLMGTLNGMLTQMSEQTDDPQLKNMVGMLSGVTESIKAGKQPDMSGMMSMMMSMMSNMNSK
jgi:hypothetical protein